MGIRRRLYERWELRRQWRRLTIEHELRRQESRAAINDIAIAAAHEMGRIAAEQRGGGGRRSSASRRPAQDVGYIDGEAWEVP